MNYLRSSLSFTILLLLFIGCAGAIPGNHDASIEEVSIEPGIASPGSRLLITIAFIPNSFDATPSFGDDLPISTPISIGGIVVVRLPGSVHYVAGSTMIAGRIPKEPAFIDSCDDGGTTLTYSFFQDEAPALTTLRISLFADVDSGDGPQTVIADSTPRLNCDRATGIEGEFIVHSPS